MERRWGQVSKKGKSQRSFVAVTLITLLALAMVLIVYATILGTFTGGNVEVVSIQGDVYYSLDNSTGWALTLSNLPVNDPWYARFNVTSTDGYSGGVQVTWNLHKGGSSFHNVTSSFTLSGSAEAIYASSNGLQAANYDWGQNSTAADTYYVEVTVDTT
jgi:hypothetical protein